MGRPDDHHGEAVFPRGGGATGELIAKHDWSATALGPIDDWPLTLKATIDIIVRSPVPMALMWGQDGVMIYNDAYAHIIGRRHPEALGAKVRELWPDLAETSALTLRMGLGGGTRSFRNVMLNVDRAGRPEQIWFDADCSPIMDAQGAPAGTLIIYGETTQRVLAEERAAREIERLRRMFEQAPGFICFLSGPNYIVEFVNEAHKQLFGDHHAEGRRFVEAFADVGAHEALDRVFASGQRYVGRAEPVLIPKPDGRIEEHLLDVVLEPVTDDDGQVIGLFIEGLDVTEQVRAQEAADESERRLSAAVAVARLGAFEWNIDSGKATMDERAREIFAFGPNEDLTIQDVISRIDREDMKRIRADLAAYEGAYQTRREFEYRLHLPDGVTRNIAAVSDWVGEAGTRGRLVGVFDDVTERRAAEKRQRMLINELNHRVKNTLATVQSIAAQTLRSTPNLLTARESFEARLVALAAAHDLLTAQSWHGARLGDVVATALAPFETLERPQIGRSGPPVWLSAPRALALSLALHELATNAAKHGALSTPKGKVTIRWSVSGPSLTLTWREEGGPRVETPVRAGFGARLLQRSLAQELNGQVEMVFAPEGVRCEIRCRLEDVRPKPQPAVGEI